MGMASSMLSLKIITIIWILNFDKLLIKYIYESSFSNENENYDKKRESRLKVIGLNVIRIDGYYILKIVTGALEIIANKINELEGKTTP